jgi:hypothetical protein
LLYQLSYRTRLCGKIFIFFPPPADTAPGYVVRFLSFFRHRRIPHLLTLSLKRLQK